MAHFVRVLPSKTFRLHPAVTVPYNADFDGDEMNIHSPQTEEARSEAKILLDVNNNLISPKNNTNLIGCISDALTGGYILGKSEILRGDAMQLLYEAGVESNFSKKTMSGKEAFSETLPEVNFEYKTKIGNLSIKNGKIIDGAIDKYMFGVEDGIFIKALDNQVGRKKTLETINKAFALGTKYLSRNGFTIALEDLNVVDKIKKTTKEIIEEAEDKTEKIITAYYDGSLELIPGKTKEESREIKILQALNEVRAKIGKIVKEEFPADNPASIMITSGAGGNVLNITQIACCVGQQALWAKRISMGYTNRTLSFFKEHDLSPKAKGFIYSSYMNGVKPYEFFFGAITGRDALMDLALRTPKSGYLYRRLANALQDLKSEYDGTVRDANERIVQFVYGEDGLDVSKAHLNKQIAPGEAIGIVTAQSFGEPSTQMALNVFHFAGVQEMQITLGLPRLIEIFDARKLPSTPTMEIYLEKEFNNEKDARTMAEKIKEVTLKEIMSEININFSDNKIEIALDNNALKSIHTSIDKVADRLNEKGFKVKAKENSLYIAGDKDFKELYKLKEKLKNTPISGIKGIKEILVVKREKDYVVLTSGSNMPEIIKIKGIDKNNVTSNNIHEIHEVFGIEAARQAIINEIHKVIEPQGLDIDERHLKLVADAMCTSGEVKGVTRMGIISEKSSILARASFETPVKHFVNATIKGSKDELASVIENVILNQPVPVGTGLPGLLVEVTGSLAKPEGKTGSKAEKKKKE
jgi:DNA-directed RNA polymerase subunit A''